MFSSLVTFVMANELEFLMDRFSLEKDIDDDVDVKFNNVVEASNVTSLCLFGNVLMSKPIFLDAIKGVLLRAWEVKSALMISEIGNRIYFFSFFM